MLLTKTRNRRQVGCSESNDRFTDKQNIIVQKPQVVMKTETEFTK